MVIKKILKYNKIYNYNKLNNKMIKKLQNLHISKKNKLKMMINRNKLHVI